MQEYVGRYRVIAPLGAGGMGEVYRAYDPALEREVALKLQPRALAEDPERSARMLREARSAAALAHPNICTIHEVGEADGVTYIAMEVVDGQLLDVRLMKRPMPLEELLRLALQLADAVAYAHDRGVVHRDLKPGNLMVSPEGRLKVLDFGLAKRVARAELTDVTTRSEVPLTRPHAILGTLPYMAPELLRGEVADARSDIWALGVILYELASGARPFCGKTGFETSAAILNDPPQPLSARVPGALQGIIARCLEKEPARRYQRAGELRAALEAVRADPSSQAAPHAGIFGRRGLVVAAVAVAVGGGVLWWAREVFRPETVAPPRIQSIVVLPLENSSGDPREEYFVAGMHEALILDLARIGLRKVIAKPTADAFKGTKKPLSAVARELGVDGLVIGSVIRSGPRVQIRAQLVNAADGGVVWANRYEREAGDVLALQNDVVGAIARELKATLTPELTARLAAPRPVSPAAHDAYLKGRSLFTGYVNAPFELKRLEATLAQFEESIRLDPGYAPPHAGISLAYLTASQGSLLPPQDTFPKARVAAQKAVRLDDSLSDAHATLGEVHTWYDWDWAAAEREIQRAVALNPDSTDALRALVSYQTLITARPDDAAGTSQRIFGIDPMNPFSRMQRVWVSFFSRRHDESIRFAETFLEAWPNHIMGPFFLAMNYGAKRMSAEVNVECGKIEKALGDAYVMQILGTCAWAYATVGQRDDARRLLRVVERPPTGIWLDPVIMANIYGALGERDRALLWLERGFSERSPNMIYLKTSAVNDPLRADARFQALLRQMRFPQ